MKKSALIATALMLLCGCGEEAESPEKGKGTFTVTVYWGAYGYQHFTGCRPIGSGYTAISAAGNIIWFTDSKGRFITTTAGSTVICVPE
jgi:hypothetical protein